MSYLTAYTADTLHLAAAVLRHVADGINLAGSWLNPAHTVHIEAGSTRRQWCEEHHTWEAAVIMYAHDGDPTDARAIGEWVDCDQEDECE